MPFSFISKDCLTLTVNPSKTQCNAACTPLKLSDSSFCKAPTIDSTMPRPSLNKASFAIEGKPLIRLLKIKQYWFHTTFLLESPSPRKRVETIFESPLSQLSSDCFRLVGRPITNTLSAALAAPLMRNSSLTSFHSIARMSAGMQTSPLARLAFASTGSSVNAFLMQANAPAHSCALPSSPRTASNRLQSSMNRGCQAK